MRTTTLRARAKRTVVSGVAITEGMAAARAEALTGREASGERAATLLVAAPEASSFFGPVATVAERGSRRGMCTCDDDDDVNVKMLPSSTATAKATARSLRTRTGPLGIGASASSPNFGATPTSCVAAFCSAASIAGA